MTTAIEETAGRFRRDSIPRARFVTASRLRFVLILGDAASLLLGAALALNFASGVESTADVLSIMAFAVGAGLLVLRSQGLFRARVSSIRVLEITRLTRSAGIYGFVLYGIDRIFHFGLRLRDVALITVVGWLALVVSRACYRAWVGWARQQGRFIRKVVIVGSNHEAARLYHLFEVHKEVGIEVVGVLGERSEAVRSGLGSLWRGQARGAAETAVSLGATGAVVCPGAVAAHDLNGLIRSMHEHHLYVHLGLGVTGFDIRRLQSSPLAYEPLMYCEPLSINKWGLIAKRVFDVVAACLMIVVAAPLLGLIALAIRIDDGKPVFFRQKRVGQNGVEFGVLKFRSMHVDAEARLTELMAGNERMGPLFKMERDPRVTRVGRFLRSSSLDELPQLFNVVKGEMSLIGPRPALPSEVETFSDEVRLRERVRPGITGLWQVEARDNPSFDAYQRLDAFYLENWSMLLDIVILIGTAEQVAMRFIGALVKSRREAAEVEKEITSPKDPAEHASLPTAVNGSSSSSPVVRPLSGRRPRHRHTSTHLTSVGETADS
jgi:exopolysaccharide biosynthesis polyprenyl glycosylphosphotransferase